MAIREVYVGGELESVRVTGGAAVVDSSPTRFDPEFSDSAFLINGSASLDFFDDTGSPTTIPVGETIWYGAYVVPGGASTVSTPFLLTDTGGRPTLRITYTPLGGGPLLVQANTSSTATAVWTTLITYNITTAFYLNVAFFTGPLKKVQLFVNGNFASEAPVANVGTGGFSSLGLAGPANGMFYSQLIVTENKPTVGARVWTRKPSGAGALQQMAGAYTNLVKTALNDTTAVISNAADQTATYQYQDIVMPTGMAMGEVWQWTRTKTDGVSPTNLQSVCRVGSTDYTTANMSGMTAGFNGLPGRWPLNPATTTKWSAATFNAAEFGMKSTA